MFHRSLALVLPLVLFLIAQCFSITAALDTISDLTIEVMDDCNVNHVVTVDPFLRTNSHPRIDSDLAIVVKSLCRVFFEPPDQPQLQARSAQLLTTRDENIWLVNRVLLI